MAAGNGPRFDSDDFAGGGGMHGRTEGARGFSEQLALQHFFADADQWLGRLADVLIDRQDQLFRKGR